MDKKEKTKLYKKSLDTWGTALQLVIVLEESSELQKEVCKIIRGDWSTSRRDSVASEIADVSIMLELLTLITKTERKVKTEKILKLNRLTQKLDASKGGINESQRVTV